LPSSLPTSRLGGGRDGGAAGRGVTVEAGIDIGVAVGSGAGVAPTGGGGRRFDDGVPGRVAVGDAVFVGISLEPGCAVPVAEGSRGTTGAAAAMAPVGDGGGAACSIVGRGVGGPSAGVSAGPSPHAAKRSIAPRLTAADALIRTDQQVLYMGQMPRLDCNGLAR